MSGATPVDKICQVLSDAGFRKLDTPLRIAGLTFEFPAAFVGTDESPDLIVVSDTAFEPDKRILQKVDGLARALDVLRSTRPLTVVLAGPRPATPVLDAMAKVCRVLPVGIPVEPDPEVALRNWLAVLTPLRLPHPNNGLADPLGEVARHLGTGGPVSAELMKVAPQGATAVQTRLHQIISESLREAREFEAP